MITLNKFTHLHRLKESKEFGYYEFVPWDWSSRLVIDLSSSFRYWKSRYFFVSGDGWETLSDNFWGNVPRLLRQWETPQIGAFAFWSPFSFLVLWLILVVLLTHFFFFQWRSALILRASSKIEFRRPLGMQGRSTILMSWLISARWPVIA